jgi:hypothetical protein
LVLGFGLDFDHKEITEINSNYRRSLNTDRRHITTRAKQLFLALRMGTCKKYMSPEITSYYKSNAGYISEL